MNPPSPPAWLTDAHFANWAGRAAVRADAAGLAVLAPFTGQPFASIRRGRPDDVVAAVATGRAAQPAWGARQAAARAALLLRAHDRLLARQEHVLDLIQLETGKARRHAFEEVADAANVLRYYAARAPGWLAAARVLVAYSVFFSFGWLLFLRHDVVASFGWRPWRYVGAGLVAAVLYMLVVLRPPVGDPTQAHLIAILAGGLAMWLLIYGVTGLFVRYCECHRPFQRYLSDASYWMYIIHLPVVIWTQGLLAPLALPAVLKFAIVLSVTTLVTLTTYHFWVRSTAIGAFLNGRRFERAWPKLRPVVA